MWFYLLRRFNLFVLTVLVLFFLVFLMAKFLPGDPIVNLSGIQNPSFSAQQEIVTLYKLDEDNWISQYVAYVKQRLNGNFGLSLNSQHPISEELKRLLPATLELCVFAMAIALLLGIPLGVIAAMRQYKVADYAIRGISLIGYSIPVFWLGMLMIMFFGLEMRWLPVSGRINLLYEVEPVTGFMVVDILLSDLSYKQQALQSVIAHLLMPTITLAVFPLTVVIRITRNAMLDELKANYIKAAESRGLSPATVIFYHALPNALQPVMRQVGLQLSTLLTSALVTEMIFSWPGIGTWMISAIYQRDFPVIQAGIIVCATIIICVSVLSDILYILSTPQRRSNIDGT